jgi:hypothetical protein
MKTQMLGHVLLVVGLALSSCGAPDFSGASFPALDFKFRGPAFLSSRGEQYFRIEAEQDVLEWIQIQHGLVVGDVAVDHSMADQLQSVLAGARIEPAGGGWIAFEFDKLPKESLSANSEADAVALRELQALASTVTVEEARLVFDEAGELTLWRKLRAEHASAWLEMAQRSFLSDAALAKTPEDVRLPGLSFDAPSFELLRSEISKGEKVWRFEGGALVTEAPMTAENARRCAARIHRIGVETSYDNGHLRIRYLPSANGWIRSMFLIENGSSKYDAAIVDELEAAGIKAEAPEAYVSLRSAAGLP